MHPIALATWDITFDTTTFLTTLTTARNTLFHLLSARPSPLVTVVVETRSRVDGVASSASFKCTTEVRAPAANNRKPARRRKIHCIFPIVQLCVGLPRRLSARLRSRLCVGCLNWWYNTSSRDRQLENFCALARKYSDGFPRKARLSTWRCNASVLGDHVVGQIYTLRVRE